MAPLTGLHSRLTFGSASVTLFIYVLVAIIITEATTIAAMIIISVYALDDNTALFKIPSLLRLLDNTRDARGGALK